MNKPSANTDPVPLNRLRAQPRAGSEVVVVFLGGRVTATITAVTPDGRTVQVVTVDGELLRFLLSLATARFQADDGSGAKLVFLS